MRIADLVVRSALSIQAERESLLAANIANADVRGFIPRDVDFAASLDDAVAAQEQGRTPDSPPIVAAVHAEEMRVDGSGVDLARASGELFQNSLNYEATMKLYGSMMARLKSATTV